jgi:hypothetical protein
MNVNKVLILAPLADQETWPGIIRACKDLGKEVVSVDPLAQPDEVLPAAEGFDGELVFLSREQCMLDRIEDLRKANKAKHILWNMDVRQSVQEWGPLLDLFRRCSVYFTPGLGNVPAFREQGINCFWHPQGLQSERYHPPSEITEEDRAKYECDVSFIGGEYGMHEGRSELLDFLQAKLPSFCSLKIWGTRGAPAIYGDEHNKAVALSKISIGHSGWAYINLYMSVRNWKILGAGGFLLANAHASMKLWLKIEGPDAVLAYYQDPDECLERIKYYLDNEEARKAIAERGHKFAMENTYRHRMQAIFDWCESSKQFSESMFFQKHFSPLQSGAWHDRIFNDETAGLIDPTVQKERAEEEKAHEAHKAEAEVVEAIPKEERPPQEIIATAASSSCKEGLLNLISSLRRLDWLGQIHIFCPKDDRVLPETEQEARDFQNTVIHPCDPWYEEFWPTEQTNRDARYLKPLIYRYFQEGDKVFIVDSADVLFLRPPDELFRLLAEYPILISPTGKAASTTPVVPGMNKLLGITLSDYKIGQSSGIGFRVCDEAKQFFDLWALACAWCFPYGYGDQRAFYTALSLYQGGWHELDPSWGWTPSHGDPDGQNISLLHSAGHGRPNYDKVLKTISLA